MNCLVESLVNVLNNIEISKKISESGEKVSDEMNEVNNTTEVNESDPYKGCCKTLQHLDDYDDIYYDDTCDPNTNTNPKPKPVSIDHLGTITYDTVVTFMELYTICTTSDVYETTYCDEKVIRPGKAVLTKGFDGSYNVLSISTEFVAAFGSNEYTICSQTEYIFQYDGKARLSSFDIRPVLISMIGDEYMEPFITRGKKFVQMTAKPTYMHATGFLYIPDVYGIMRRYELDSRVVIDPKGYRKFQSANRWHSSKILKGEHAKNKIYSALSTVPVYSLGYRRWGEVCIDKLRDIVFDDSAFDRIVLPDDYRNIVKSLVTNFYHTRCSDFLNNGKRGMVFLLNGKPGTGKTLTAKSIAELIHKPVYAVGSGDLGSSAEIIDRNLQNIFSIVQDWDGIVLIDEADVFMAQRKEANITYNSCVSVFLRLIEEYTGILFLTSNLGHVIDDAFRSRVHVALQYEELGANERKKVWRETLSRYGANCRSIDLNDVSKCELNNREIANCVQLAYIQCGGEAGEINTKLLLDNINMRLRFDNK